MKIGSSSQFRSDKLKLKDLCKPSVTMGWKFYPCFLIAVNILVMSCASTTTTTQSRRQAAEPRGFFASLMDQMTERECNVGRFTCPFGLGPAGELCDCTDPSGIVLNGRTVK